MTQFKHPIRTHRRSPEPIGYVAPPTCLHNNRRQNNNSGRMLGKAAACSVCFGEYSASQNNLHHGRRLLCHLETGRQWEFWWVHESTWWVTCSPVLFIYVLLFCFRSCWLWGVFGNSHILPLSAAQAWALPPGRLVMWPSRLWSSAMRATRWRSAPRAPSKTQRSPSSSERSLTRPLLMTGTAK